MGNCFGTDQGRSHSPVTTNRSTSAADPEKYKGKGINGCSREGTNTTPTGKNININNIHEVEIKDGEKETINNYNYNRSTTRSGSGEKELEKVILPCLKIFSLDELKIATRNFRPDNVVGEGGFGRVFKGWLEPNTYKPSRQVSLGIPVAVKKSNHDSLQGLKEWQSEVKFLGKFSHPNLVKLIGYCWEEDLFLLVYEYMVKGSLDNHLFGKGPQPLPWHTRLKIAIGAARGLTFLHTSEKSVIYRDFKSSNILLDGDYNAKLSDFGLAKLGPINGKSHVTTRVMGTYGYAAPEYIATGHLYVKSDVYGFGVVLLEMLTGLPAMDKNRPSGEHSLVDKVKPYLNDKKKLKKIMEPRLGDHYSRKGAFKAAQLIHRCLESEPKDRPSMEEVLETLEKVNQFKDYPMDSDNDTTTVMSTLGKVDTRWPLDKHPASSRQHHHPSSYK